MTVDSKGARLPHKRHPVRPYSRRSPSPVRGYINSWPTTLISEHGHVFLLYAFFKVLVLAYGETVFFHVSRIVVGYVIGQFVPPLSVQHAEVPIARRLSSASVANKLTGLEKDGWRERSASAVTGRSSRDAATDLVHDGSEVVKIVRHLTRNLEIQFIYRLGSLARIIPKVN